MKKADMILLSIILIICLGVIFVLEINSKEGASVRIMVDGTLVDVLSTEKNQEYRVNTDMGENVVVVEEGYVYVMEADCPDKVCVKHKPINSIGETIICLPHKLVVEIGD